MEVLGGRHHQPQLCRNSSIDATQQDACLQARVFIDLTAGWKAVSQTAYESAQPLLVDNGQGHEDHMITQQAPCKQMHQPPAPAVRQPLLQQQGDSPWVTTSIGHPLHQVKEELSALQARSDHRRSVLMDLRASQTHTWSHLARAAEVLGTQASASSTPEAQAATTRRLPARPASAQVRRRQSHVPGAVTRAPTPCGPQPAWSPGATVCLLTGAGSSVPGSRRAATAALVAEHQEQGSSPRMWQRLKATGIIKPSLPQPVQSASAPLQGSTSYLVPHARAAALLSLLTADAQPVGGAPAAGIASHDLRLTCAEPALADVEAEAVAERDMARLTCVVQAGRSMNDEEGDVCCVCLEPLQSGRLRALRCGHVMHETCCRGVMRAHVRTVKGQKGATLLRCPLCRMPAAESDL